MPRFLARFLALAALALAALAAPASAQFTPPSLLPGANDPLGTQRARVLARDSVQAFYRFDEASFPNGGTLLDETGNDNGFISAPSGGLTATPGIAPRSGGAATFVASTASVVGLIPMDASEDWAIGIDLAPSAGGQGPLITVQGGTGTAITLLEIDNATKDLTWAWDGGAKSFDTALEIGAENIVLVAHDASASDLTMYLNGYPVDTVAVTTPSDADGALRLALNAAASATLQNTKVDNLVVYNRVPTAAEVREYFLERHGTDYRMTDYEISIFDPLSFNLTTGDSRLQIDVTERAGRPGYHNLVGHTLTQVSGPTATCGIESSLVDPSEMTLYFDPAGGVYDPEVDAACLFQLTGPGGKVADIPVQLRIAEGAPSDVTDAIAVATHADLEALRMPADSLGTYRKREGYHASGDGGGLIFTLVRSSVIPPIPGLIIPAGARTAKTDVRQISGPGRLDFQTSCAPIVPGTLTGTITGTDAGGNPYSKTFTDAYMYGIGGPSADPTNFILNHRTGRIREFKVGGYGFEQSLGAHLGGASGAAYTASVRLDYDCAVDAQGTPDNLLWLATHTEAGERLAEVRRWSALWTGAEGDDPGGPYRYRDVLPSVGWGEQAIRLHNAQPQTHAQRRVKVLLLPDPECIPEKGGSGTACDGEVYWRTAAIRLPSETWLAGSQGTTLIDSTFTVAVDSAGTTGSVTRTIRMPIVTDSATVLRHVPPFEADTTGCAQTGAFCRRALGTLDMQRDYAHEHHIAPDEIGLFGHYYSVIFHDPGSTRAGGIHDLVVDNNRDAHAEDVFGTDDPAADLTGEYSFTDLQGTIWNAPAHNGYATSDQGGHYYGNNFRVRIENSAFMGNLGNSILLSDTGDRSLRDELLGVVFGGSDYAHDLYSYGCVNVRSALFNARSWNGYIVAFCMDAQDVVFTDLVPGRRSGGTWMVENRNGVGQPDTLTSIIENYSLSHENGPWKLDNFWVDARPVNTIKDGPDAGKAVPTSVLRKTFLVQGGPGIEISNGVIVTSQQQGFEFYDAKLTDNNKGVQWSGFEVRNLDWVEGGGENEQANIGLHWLKDHSFSDPRIDGVRFHHVTGLASKRRLQTCLRLAEWETNKRRASDGPVVAVFDSLGTADDPMECESLFSINTKADGVQQHWITNSHFNNTSGRLAFADGTASRGIGDECPAWPVNDGSGGCRALDSTQVFLDNDELEMNVFGADEQWLLAAVWRLRDVTDTDTGLTSEATEQLTCSGGETTLDFRPGLLWGLHPARGVVTLSSAQGTTASSYIQLDSDQNEIVYSLPGRSDPARLQNPTIRVTLSQACQAGEVVTGSFEVADMVDHNGDPASVPTEPAAPDTLQIGPWTWVNLPPSSPGATDGHLCRTGAPSGYAFRRSPTGADSTVVHGEGGGAGFDLETYNATPSFRTATEFAEWWVRRSEQNPTAGPGILAVENTDNPAYNHNVVYMPYCTADVGIGQNADYDVPGDSIAWYEPNYLGQRAGGDSVLVGQGHEMYLRQQHVGVQNTLAVLDDLASRFGVECKDQDLFTTIGMSAGGFRALGIMQTVHDRCTDGTADPRLLFISDAGPSPRLDTALPAAAQLLWRTAWNPPVPTGCPTGETTESCDRADGDVFSNQAKHFLTANPDVVAASLSTEGDRVVRAFFSHSPSCQKNCLNSEGAVSAAAFSEGLYDVRTFWPSNFASFYYPGTGHTQSLREDFYTKSIEGVTIADWYRLLFQGTEVHLPSAAP